MKQSLGKVWKQPVSSRMWCCQQWIPSSPSSTPHIPLLTFRKTEISLLLISYFGTSSEPPPWGSLLHPPWEGVFGYHTALCWAPPGTEGPFHDEHVHHESVGKISICCSTAWDFKTEALPASELKQSFEGFFAVQDLPLTGRCRMGRNWVQVFYQHTAKKKTPQKYLYLWCHLPTFENCLHFMAFEPHLSS